MDTDADERLRDAEDASADGRARGRHGEAATIRRDALQLPRLPLPRQGRVRRQVRRRRRWTIRPARSARGGSEEEEPMSPPFIFMVAELRAPAVAPRQVGRPPIAQKAAEDRHDRDQERARRGREAARAGRRPSSPSTRRALKAADAEIKQLVEGMRAGRRGRQGADPRATPKAQSAQMKRDAETADRRGDRARARRADPGGHRGRRGARPRSCCATRSTRTTSAKLVTTFINERRHRPRGARADASGSLARRYAKAIFEIGSEQGGLDKIGADLRSLAKAMKDSPSCAPR